MMEDTTTRRMVVCAGISGAMAVAMGSFAAHGLEEYLSSSDQSGPFVLKRLRQFDVAVRYHLIHSVALLALSSVRIGSPGGRRWVARLFVTGLILFSGSLYLLVLTNTPQLGAITPLGGLSWIVGWLLLLWMVRPTGDASLVKSNHEDSTETR